MFIWLDYGNKYHHLALFYNEFKYFAFISLFIRKNAGLIIVELETQNNERNILC